MSYLGTSKLVLLGYKLGTIYSNSVLSHVSGSNGQPCFLGLVPSFVMHKEQAESDRPLFQTCFLLFFFFDGVPTLLLISLLLEFLYTSIAWCVYVAICAVTTTIIF